MVAQPRALSKQERKDALDKAMRLRMFLNERKTVLEPMFYGAPDLLFKKGFTQGYFDPDTKEIVREPLDYEETQEQHKQRQNQAIYDLVTEEMSIVKDDKIVKILLIPKMAKTLADLFYGRIKRLILWGPRGGGKSLAYGTPVMKSDGSVVPVETLVPGDKLMGPNGKPRIITGTQPGHGPLYRITPAKGESWACNEHHILTLIPAGSKNMAEMFDIDLLEWIAQSEEARAKNEQFKARPDEYGNWRITESAPISVEPIGDGDYFGIMLDGDGRFLLGGSTVTHNSLLAAIYMWICFIYKKKSCINMGGCLLPGSLVWTTKGWKKIEDIIAGVDLILGRNGEPTLVSKVFRKQWDGTASSILPAGFSESNHFTDDHEILVFDRKPKEGEEPVWIPAGKLTDDCWLAIPRGNQFDWDSSFGEKPSNRAVAYRYRLNNGSLQEELEERKRRVLKNYICLRIQAGELYYYKGPVYDLVVPEGSSFGMPGLHAHNSGNQARRVYDYTKQFWHLYPNMQDGMLERDPLLQSTEMSNGSRLVCSTSVSTAIGEHIGTFLADEASLLPWCQLLTSDGVQEISSIEPGQLVIGREGTYQKVLKRFSHPYEGRILWVRPYGSAIPAWITEEHRVWAIQGVTWERKGKDRKRRCAGPQDIIGRSPDWVRAFDLDKNDILCYPRARQKGEPFKLELEGRSLAGPDLWRFFGYWAGDGGIALSRGSHKVRLHLSEAKSHFLDDAKATMEFVSSRDVRVNQSPSRGKAIELVVHDSESLRHTLLSHVGVKEERGFPTEWFERATNEELKNYLIGHIRTDGTKSFRKDGVLGSWSVTTTAEGLALNLIYAFNRLGLSHNACRRESGRYGERSRDRWDIHMPPSTIQAILPEDDLRGIRFPSADVAKRTWFDETWCYSVIKDIEEDYYEGPVYDLEMDGDPSFGTPACTMLHNCTDRPGADHDLMRAMQGAMSEDPHSIFLLSTFHLPVGFFANVWDNADDMGFVRTTWSCFDIMEKCDAGLEFATVDDPQAIENFCKTKCDLSWEEDVLDEFGVVTGREWKGCVGHARNSEGWQTREQVLDEQRINKGTRIFFVEHCCYRPQSEGKIYNKKLVEACVVPYFGLCVKRRKIIGIDWGLTQCAIVLVGEWSEEDPANPNFPLEGVGLVDVVFMSNRLVDAVVDQIRRWQLRYGDDVIIRADGSHPYNNLELANHGYIVKPVHGDRKLLGEDNMARWIGSGFFRILEGFSLFMAQMHNLRRSAISGKQLKQNKEGEEGDHGPDALKFALLSVSCLKWLERRKQEKEALDGTKKRDLPTVRKGRRTGLDSLLD